MSTSQNGRSLLSLLDKSFEARLRRKDLASLVPAPGAVNELFDSGILKVAAEADTASCPYGDHEGDGLVPVAKDERGVFTGLCPEHGRAVKIPAEDVEWVVFHPDNWMEALHSINGLIDEPVRNAGGFLFAGTYRTMARKVGIVMVSSQAQGNPSDFRPRDVALKDWLYVTLGDEPSQGGGTYAVVAGRDAFQHDLLRFNQSVIGAALSRLEVEPSPAVQYLKFSSGRNKPEILSLKKYREALSAAEIRRHDFVVDLPGNRAWTRGKQIEHMANRGEKGRKKPLSPKGLKLVAGFMRQPGAPLCPYRLDPYFGDGRDAGDKKTAQAALLKMRKTLGMDKALTMTHNPSGDPGDGLYAFNPDCKYMLITSDETS